MEKLLATFFKKYLQKTRGHDKIRSLTLFENKKLETR